tara:strand:+ start:34034 stop:34285 length:252 start_codon:yes stop_codon:yes gene_type:complete
MKSDIKRQTESAVGRVSSKERPERSIFLFQRRSFWSGLMRMVRMPTRLRSLLLLKRMSDGGGGTGAMRDGLCALTHGFPPARE